MSAGKEESYWVGFDLGGAKMLAVLFDREFRPIGRQRKRTNGQSGAEAGVKRIITLIETSARRGEGGTEAGARHRHGLSGSSRSRSRDRAGDAEPRLEEDPVEGRP